MNSDKPSTAAATVRQLEFIDELLKCGMFSTDRQKSIRTYQGLPNITKDHARQLISTLLHRKKYYDLQRAEELSWAGSAAFDRAYEYDHETQD